MQKTDARNVKSNYTYTKPDTSEDPLNRIQKISYDISGSSNVLPAPDVTYSYMTAGDKARISQVRTAGVLTEDFSHDSEGRLYESTETVDGRTSYPIKMTYLYDSLDRTTEVRYPAQYGLSGSPRKIIEPTYDTASRLSSLKVNSVVQAGDIVYNSSDQTESIKIGTAGTNQVTETYQYDGLSGLLTNQKAIRNGTNLLDLSYDYAKNNSVGTGTGKTGHLTKTTDNLNNAKNKEYEFDALGRLTKAKGGNNLWTQTYSYDRFGNRTNVVATGNGIDGQPMQKDGIGNLTYDNLTNRITNSGVTYDVAGNQTRALAEDGVTWLKYEYDAANRLQIIKKDDGSANGINWQAFQYGSTNQRLMDYDYFSGTFKIFGSGGSIEYTEFTSAVMTWTKSYVHLGDSILSTNTPNGNGGETTEFNHPDRLGTRIVTNQTTGTTTEQASLPFGTALSSETSRSESKRFTSYDRSVRTGLDYAINRTYDSKLGRFTQVDPIKMSSVSLSAPQTLNLYSYCGNDPINHTDPNGLFFGFLKKLFNAINKILLWVVVIIAIVLLVAFIVHTAGGALPAFLGDGIGWLLGLVGKIAALSSSFMATAVGIEVGNAVGFSIAAGIYGVGAVVSALGGDDKKKKKKKEGKIFNPIEVVGLKDSISPIIEIARKKALKRLKRKRCRDYVLGPIGAGIYSDAMLEKVSVLFDPNVPATAAAQSILQGGLNSPIRIGNTGIRGSTTTNTGNIEYYILHELRHTLGGLGHPRDKNDVQIESGTNSDADFQKKIRENCF